MMQDRDPVGHGGVQVRHVVIFSGSVMAANTTLLSGMLFDPVRLTASALDGLQREQLRLHARFDLHSALVLDDPPRPAHGALARLQRALEARQGSLLLCTGNVDRLHEHAGAGLHGVVHMMKASCGACQALVDYIADMGQDGACPGCGARDLLINCKLFWGSPSRSEAARLRQAIQRADLFLAIGMEVGMGTEAGALIGEAAMADVPVLAINPGGSHLIHDGIAERIGLLDELVPAWVAEVLGGDDPGGLLIPKESLVEIINL